MTHPGRVIFVAGGELTLFMPEIIPGKSVTARLTHLKADPALLGNGKLDAYLATLVPSLRAGSTAGPSTQSLLPESRMRCPGQDSIFVMGSGRTQRSPDEKTGCQGSARGWSSAPAARQCSSC